VRADSTARHLTRRSQNRDLLNHAHIAGGIAIPVPHKYYCEFEIKFAFTGETDDRARWTRSSADQLTTMLDMWL
jgi:hypothetical protein